MTSKPHFTSAPINVPIKRYVKPLKKICYLKNAYRLRSFIFPPQKYARPVRKSYLILSPRSAALLISQYLLGATKELRKKKCSVVIDSRRIQLKIHHIIHVKNIYLKRLTLTTGRIRHVSKLNIFL